MAIPPRSTAWEEPGEERDTRSPPGYGFPSTIATHRHRPQGGGGGRRPGGGFRGVGTGEGVSPSRPGCFRLAALPAPGIAREVADTPARKSAKSGGSSRIYSTRSRSSERSPERSTVQKSPPDGNTMVKFVVVSTCTVPSARVISSTWPPAARSPVMK